MLENEFGIPYNQIDTIRTIDPEVAAHNIALTYIQAAFGKSIALPDEDNEVEWQSVCTIAQTYTYAYNYAYNFIVHDNELINQAEKIE